MIFTVTCKWIPIRNFDSTFPYERLKRNIEMILTVRQTLSLETARCVCERPPTSCVLCVSHAYMEYTHERTLTSVVWVVVCVSVTWKLIDKSAREQRRKPAYVAPPIFFGVNGPPICGRGDENSSYLFACRQCLWMHKGYKSSSPPFPPAIIRASEIEDCLYRRDKISSPKSRCERFIKKYI